MPIPILHDQLPFFLNKEGVKIYGIPFGTKVKIDHGDNDSLAIFKAKNFPINLIDILTSDDYHHLLDGEFVCDTMPAHVISDGSTGKVYVEPDFDLDGSFPEITDINSDDKWRGYLVLDHINRLKYVHHFYRVSIPSQEYLSACKEIINALDFSFIRKIDGQSFDEMYVHTIFDMFCYFRLKTPRKVHEWDLNIPARMMCKLDKTAFFNRYKSLKGKEYQVYCLMLSLFRADRTRMLSKDPMFTTFEISKYQQLIHTIFQKVR